MDDVHRVAKSQSLSQTDNDLVDGRFIPNALRNVPIVQIFAGNILHDDIEVSGVIVGLIDLNHVIMVDVEENLALILDEIHGIILAVLGPW